MSLAVLATTAAVVWSVTGLSGLDDRPTAVPTPTAAASTDAASTSATPGSSGTGATASPDRLRTETEPVPDLDPLTIKPGDGQPRQTLPTPGHDAGRRAIARACAIRTFSVDTHVDTTRRDAAARCSRYATPAYARALNNGVVRTDSEWEAWVADGVYTTVEATPIPSPGQDVTDSRLISWRLTITTHARGGAISAAGPIDVAVAVTPARIGGRVDGLILL